MAKKDYNKVKRLTGQKNLSHIKDTNALIRKKTSNLIRKRAKDKNIWSQKDVYAISIY